MWLGPKVLGVSKEKVMETLMGEIREGSVLASPRFGRVAVTFLFHQTAYRRDFTQPLRSHQKCLSALTHAATRPEHNFWPQPQFWRLCDSKWAINSSARKGRLLTHNCSVELVIQNVMKLGPLVPRAAMQDCNVEATKRASSSTSKWAQTQTLFVFAGLSSPKKNEKV